MTARGRAGGRGPAQEPSVAQIYEEALLPGERGLGPVQGRRMLHQPRVQGQQGYRLSPCGGRKRPQSLNVCVCPGGCWYVAGLGCRVCQVAMLITKQPQTQVYPAAPTSLMPEEL